MASASFVQRHFLLCPFCQKSQQGLSAHLRRTCMKSGTTEQIDAVVEKAKADVHDLLRFSRVWTYELVREVVQSADPVNRLIQELEKRHQVVTGKPALAASEAPAASAAPSASQAPVSEDPRQASGHDSDASSQSSGEYFQGTPKPDFNCDKRTRMAEMGLYKKHCIDHPLKEFGRYLSQDLHNKNFKQEVENVARVMYFMNPAQPSLEFVRQREKTQEYLRLLNEAKLAKQRKINYLKSLKRQEMLWQAY